MRSRWIHLVMAAIAVTAAAATISFPEHGLVERFAPNVATDALTAPVTISFVQRFLERQERARRLRGSIGGLRRAGSALSRMCAAWAALVRVSLSHRAFPLPSDPAELFSDYVTEDLMYCDTRAPRNGVDGDSWARWAAAELAEARESLQGVLGAHRSALDPEYAEALNALVDDAFLQLIVALGVGPGPGPEARSWRLRVNAARDARSSHFAHLLTAVQLHNTLAADAARIRSVAASPRTREFGIPLARDFDLAVRLDPDGGPAAADAPLGGGRVLPRRGPVEASA